MPRITRVYTGIGDDGTTRLGGGQKVDKDSPRTAAYGTVDELNAVLGAARACGLAQRTEAAVGRIQNELFHLGSDLCILEEDKERLEVPRIEERHVESLERLIDELTEELGALENFILPGGADGAALLHLARTVCRRAERDVVRLARREAVGPFVVKYLNRLSDALFVLARAENCARGVEETLWDSRT